MKKAIWYFMIIVSSGVLACKSQTIQSNNVNFEFTGENTGNGSFTVSQLTGDKKTKLLVSGNPLKLKITTHEQVYDLKKYTLGSTELKVQILEYQEPLKSIFTEIPIPNKPNPVIKTWNATEGKILIQLIEGQSEENRDCTNPYIVTVKLSDVKFTENDSKQTFSLKTQVFNNFRVGWCPD